MINLSTYFKFLSRNKFYTFVTTFGFAVSLMFVVLIAVYVTQELSVDKFQENGDRIYVMANENNISSADRIGYQIMQHFPEVEVALPIALNVAGGVVTINDGQRLGAETMMTGEEFFQVFSFPLVEGNKEDVLRARNSAVVSETFARKAFGDRDPIGQSIHYNDSVNVTVTGVMRDIKQSAIDYADVVIPNSNALYFSPWMNDYFENAGSSVTFLLVHPGADINSKAQDISDFLRERYWIYERGILEKVQLIPLSEFYFTEIDSMGYLRQGDKSFVLILMTVGFIILLFAVFNYVNLTVAQTSFRAKEMGIRSLVGAKPGESFLRLGSESVILSYLSLAIGILLAFLCVPYANNLLNTELNLNGFFSLSNILLILLAAFALGILSGLFPGYIISRFQPIDIVKGNFKVRSKMTFSKVFIIIQNILTISLLAAAFIIANQVKHLIDAPLEYNNKDIIYHVNEVGPYTEFQSLDNELNNLASVKRTAFSQGTPFNRGNNNTFVHDGQNISMQILNGDSAFFDMMGFEILKDNHTSNVGKIYLNEQAYKELNLDDDAATVPEMNWSLDGKVKDFQLGNILGQTKPVAIGVADVNNFYPWNILIETQGDPGVAYQQVKEVYERVTGLNFKGEYMEDQIAETFAAQQRLLKIIAVFCGIAILISMLGLMAISTYFIRQRSKEIAIRKTMGSTNANIVLRLIGSFLIYVLIAFIITVPVMYYIMTGWLEDYSYRISISPWFFILAGLFSLLISFITVFFQSYRASTANPVDYLKNE